MSSKKRIIEDELNDDFLKENHIIFKKYKPIKIISKGTFGRVYSTIRLDDKSVFAMKTELIKQEKNLLESEAYYLLTLQGFGIPKIITYGHSKKYNILIETLLGKSLYDIYILPKKVCLIKDLCLIAFQLLDRLQFIHSKDIIYRDVKPENFLIGIEDPNVIYVVDFGLCKKYRSTKTGRHILPKNTKKFNGTVKYASSNAIKGKELSRRDDLISLGYVLIFLFKRCLPWTSNFKSLNRRTYFELIYSKETNGGGELFKFLPEELIEYAKYTINLKFEEQPDYNFLRGCFQKLLTKNDLNINNINFFWINPNDKKLLGLPRNHSSKRSNSHLRLLKDIESERNKRLNINNNKGSSVNISNINNEMESKELTNPNVNNNLMSHKKLRSDIATDNNQQKIPHLINNLIDKKYRTKKISLVKKIFERKSNNHENINININNESNTSLINEKNVKTFKNVYINSNNNIFLNIDNNNTNFDINKINKIKALKRNNIKILKGKIIPRVNYINKFKNNLHLKTYSQNRDNINKNNNFNLVNFTLKSSVKNLSNTLKIDRTTPLADKTFLSSYNNIRKLYKSPLIKNETYHKKNNSYIINEKTETLPKNYKYKKIPRPNRLSNNILD